MKKLVLASASPRRKYLLEQMGFSFELRVQSIDESQPAHIGSRDLACYLAEQKAQALAHSLAADEILLAADTVVLQNGECFGKAQSPEQAHAILSSLSGKMHEVITGVCLLGLENRLLRSAVTRVYFRELHSTEIDFYIQNYAPFDKAGAYGIQEWIGLVGIEKIEGSYNNVMGLPTHLVYRMWQEINH